ncbi:MAG TPA: hypothetical protein VF832_09035, partial [Longimicrobiales bacterium]
RKPGDDDDPDPFAPVRLTHAKATLTARGPRIVWKPTACEHGVYLHAQTDSEGLYEDARRLHDHIAQASAGVTGSEIHKKPPAGLPRLRAERALHHLVETGRVIATVEDRPRNPGVTVYRVTRMQP